MNDSARRASRWADSRDLAITIVGWAAVIAVVFLLLSRIGHVVLLLVLASLVAYIVAPGVRYFERYMPRFLALALVYVLAIAVIGLVGYVLIDTATRQAQVFTHRARELLAAAPTGGESPAAQFLARFGITPAQLETARQQATGYAERAATDVLPVLKGIVDSVLDLVLVVVLSVYLVVDERRVGGWIDRNTPADQRSKIDFARATLQRIVGGYIRGQLLLSVIIGVLVGVGMALFRVPGAVLLGMLAFVAAFVPILGTFVSGAACVLVALTRGWPIAIGVLVYFVLMHVIEGDILGPRIVGRALGLHPVLSILAVIAGSELFGIKGALFAAPTVGLVQALAAAAWEQWKHDHPDQFRGQSEGLSVPAGAAAEAELEPQTEPV